MKEEQKIYLYKETINKKPRRYTNKEEEARYRYLPA